MKIDNYTFVSYLWENATMTMKEIHNHFVDYEHNTSLDQC